MGSFVSVPAQRALDVSREMQALAARLSSVGEKFPGSEHRPVNRKVWMAELGPEKVRLNQVVWPGSHNSATNEIGIPFITRPFAQCQSLSVYEQLATGCRLLDVRIQKDRRVCHGVLETYHVDVVLADVKRFLTETESEVLVLEIRTEFGHDDPPDFVAYLVEQLGEEYLIPQNEAVFHRTIAELLPRRLICVWKPHNPPPPNPSVPLWSKGYLRDNGQLDRHRPAGDQVREQHQVPRPAAGVRDRPEILLPGGEHGDAAGRQPSAVRGGGDAPHPPLRPPLHRRGLCQGHPRQAAGLLHRLHRRQLRRRLRRRHQGTRRRRG